MKKILLIGHEKDLGDKLSRRFYRKGYSIQQTLNLNKALRVLKFNTPDFVLCTGKIKMDSDGNYYLEP